MLYEFIKTRNMSEFSSSSAEVDFLELCTKNVGSIVDTLAKGENLLNHRQCLDLSSKLSQTILNIRDLVLHCGAYIILFRPALENLYRYLEKAKLLVTNCAEEDWCAAAVFQCQNENAFREILLDVGFCYNAIYELAKSQSKEQNDHPEDLRQSSLFDPATGSDVLADKQDLQKRLDELANGHNKSKAWEYVIPGRIARKQSLAKYLLVKMHCTSLQPQANTLDTYSAILWTKASEPSGTWGRSRFLGAGSGASGVVSTSWLGIPCAKKEFHGQESESSFMKEAGILAHLKHPCIVNFICCGNGLERGDRFIAMELMEMSLFHLIEEQREKGEYFSVPVAVDMMVQMARGVWYLHGQGIAHRDLKPQNVVVNRLSSPQVVDHFCVKLVDFGVSKAEVEISKSNTVTYQGIGTTMYRAPEVHPKANPDGRGKVNWFKADAFSFAVLCAHLLSLETPFKYTKHGELYSEITKNSKRPDIPNIFPQDLVVLVRDCWKTNPRSRPSFVEICIRLEEGRHKVFRNYSTQNQVLKENKHDLCEGSDLIKLNSSLSQGLEVDEFTLNEGFDFIKIKLEPSMKNLLHDQIEGEMFEDTVSIIPCAHGHSLELLESMHIQYPLCDMCWENIDGELYHCETCQFEAHPQCAEIKDKVEVFFHDHPLHLLVQNYYSDKLDFVCYFCEESLQHREWVYRCEQCDIDVHALCTKFPKEQMWKRAHPHLLTTRQCPPRKSMSCRRCLGEIKEYTWHYTCWQQSCAFHLHPLCTILPWTPICIFDISHRLSLHTSEGSFHCGRCGALGISWFYHCNDCDVDIHPDCVDYMGEGISCWNGTYERVKIEDGSKDDHTKMNMISELLEKMPVSDASEASSSSRSGPPPVMTKVQPSSQRLTSMERIGSDTFKYVNLRRMISAETAGRVKAKKMEAKSSRVKSKENVLKMLEKLEKILVELRSSGNVSQNEVLTATHEKLKTKQYLVKEQVAMQVQSKMGEAPRIAVFFQHSWKEGRMFRRELLINLQAGMKGVNFALLCEEPGHEHIVHGTTRIHDSEFREGEAEKILQPLLASGLQVVTRAMRRMESQELTDLGSVTVPILGGWSWDLQAIDREKNGNPNTLTSFKDKEAKVDQAPKCAEDCAAEWFQSRFENVGMSILKKFGLQRVRYKVTKEGDCPGYERGTLAWLCTDHLKSGVKDGAEIFLVPTIAAFSVGSMKSGVWNRTDMQIRSIELINNNDKDLLQICILQKMLQLLVTNPAMRGSATKYKLLRTTVNSVYMLELQLS